VPTFPVPGIPDISILGWTPTAGQLTAAEAAAAGVIGALVLILLWRKARRALLLAILAVTLLIAWARLRG